MEMLYTRLFNDSNANPPEAISDTTRVLYLVAIFVATFVSSVLPLQIISNLRNVVESERRTFYRRIVSVLNCFAGGVFLGTILLDLLPNVTEIMEKKFSSKFPFGEFCVAFGFLIILSFEQILFDCRERSSDCRNPIQRLQSRNVQLETETLTVNVQDETTQPNSAISTPVGNESTGNVGSTFHSLLLLAALSLHSLFEGFAFGVLGPSDVVVQLLVAIILHKIPVAFSVGLNLVQSELKISAVIHFDLWFSLMTPIGAGIGVLLFKFVPVQQLQLFNGIVVGIATGTFMFIVFVEILPKELKEGKARLLNLLFLIMGFSFICGATLLDTKILLSK